MPYCNAAVVGLLARLVSFPTVSRDSNSDCVAFIRDYLAAHGVDCRLIPDVGGTKASLLARIGPARPGGIVLSGHTDVVPVDGQAWTGDPFVLRQDHSRLYGRGTADMKGFLAAVLAAVPHMAAADLRVPVHLAFSHERKSDASARQR